MSGRERRTAERYVIGGLLLDINGVLHETLDVSSRAVALVQERSCDYARLNVAARFVCKNMPDLNVPVTSLQFITRRASLVVLGYEVDVTGWEDVLRNHDVRADMKQLEDVFG